MPNYNGPRMSPDEPVGHCLCGLNKGAHEPCEAYYMEMRLEGRMSSSHALRSRGCPEYRESGLSLREAMALRGCEYKWRRVQRGDAEVPAYHG